MLHEVASQSAMLDVIGRLQPYFQNRWRKQALDIKKMKGAYPEFNDLCNFIAEIAAEVNDPVYGKHAVKRSDKPPKSGFKVVSNVTWLNSAGQTAQATERRFPTGAKAPPGNGRSEAGQSTSKTYMRPEPRASYVM